MAKLRVVLQMLIDALAIFSVFTIVYLFCGRYVLHPGSYVSFSFDTHAKQYIQLLVPLIVIYMLAMILSGTYRSLWQYAQLKEILVCTFMSYAAGIVYFIFCRTVFANEKVPAYFYLLIMNFVTVALIFERVIYRVFRESVKEGQRIRDKNSMKRTMIVGCGDGSRTMLSEIKISDNCQIYPVVAIDDNPAKKGSLFCGLKICGNTSDIVSVCKKYDIDLIIIAIPSATNKRRAEILDFCSETGCEVKILPRLYDFEKENKDFLLKLREITPDELLGREVINVANEHILSVISGRTVIVTGGGGSIGSELCRQIAANSPKQLIIVDIYENNAYDIQQELNRKYGASLNLEVLIASVRDYERMNSIIRHYMPDVIIHAAAHKHVPLMEVSPMEAVKNNVFGTYNVALCAKNNGIKKFIMVSTDKAVNPTNIMGATKRVCEMIIQSLNGGETKYAAVRFGNVLGSNGSVIPLFKKQISDGGPVTVTHPDIIRYFMTIPEAVQLVLTAGAIANGGETFILDMGEPVKILHLARKMIHLAGFTADKDIEIKFIGLRPGEKLFEELLMNDEALKKTVNDKIFVSEQPKINSKVFYRQLEELEKIVSDNDRDDADMALLIEKKLMEIVPTFARQKPVDIEIDDEEAIESENKHLSMAV